MASTQEFLHSMFSHNIEAAIMKIYLQKSYDYLDWGFMQSLLEKIGLKSSSIRWIMACIENVNYVVIINRFPSPLFRVERGLRQGYPLSPLLFILAMNSMSTHINKAVDEKLCNPIKICKHIFISHNLFVDDVLLFAMLSRAYWICLKNILERFQKAFGLIINKEKSFLYHNDSNRDMIIWITQLFGIESRSLKDGIKYFGFHLKAKSYSRNDWLWLSDRFFKNISMWEHRSLSLGGRVILTQSVLMQLAVYWAHLFILLASIILSMRRISANFIWGAKADRGKFHLSKMDSIAMLKKLGCWGLMDQRLFDKALVCKSMWRGIFGNGPWSVIIQKKYLKGRSMEHWFRSRPIGIKQGSAIWHNFRKMENTS